MYIHVVVGSPSIDLDQLFKQDRWKNPIEQFKSDQTLILIYQSEEFLSAMETLSLSDIVPGIWFFLCNLDGKERKRYVST